MDKQLDGYTYEDGLAIWMLMSLDGQSICGNCYCHETPQWRRGYLKSTQQHLPICLDHIDERQLRGYLRIPLCNACGLKFNMGKYCYGCYQIFGPEVVQQHPNLYIRCTNCGHYDHKSCVTISSTKNYHCNKCE